MKGNKINVRVRLVVIHDRKVLVQYREKGKFYHYIGGHLEYGETIEQACIRETKEECGKKVIFEFQKILYIRDFIQPNVKYPFSEDNILRLYEQKRQVTF